MSTINRAEFNSYLLSNEVFFDFNAEKVATAENLKAPQRTYSISIRCLNFAMTQNFTDLANLMIKLIKNMGNSRSLNEEHTFSSRLTPLHVATLLLRTDFISKLVDVGADVNAVDHRNWTPLHHAALAGDAEIMQFLCDHGANRKALNDSEGTFSDILRLTQPPKQTPDALTNLLWETADGKIEKLTQQKFKELTGAQYLEENYVDRTWMIAQWRKPKQVLDFPEKPSPAIQQLFKQQYNQIFSTPIIYKMQKITHNDQTKKLISSPGFGLFATKNHKMGEVLGEYKAHIGPQDQNDLTLQIYWQALKHRNEMAIANDAFPNAMALTIRDCHGCPERMIFVSIAPIEEGEEICWDYSSNHNVKLQPYAELKGHALRKFFNSCNSEKEMVRLQSLDHFSKFSFTDLALHSQLQYMIETPIVLFNMVWDGSTDAEQLKKFIKIALQYHLKGEEIARNQIDLIKMAEVALYQMLHLTTSKDVTAFSKYLEHLTQSNGIKKLFPIVRKQMIRFSKMGSEGQPFSLPEDYVEPTEEK